jgi:hypothetical protein
MKIANSITVASESEGRVWIKEEATLNCRVCLKSKFYGSCNSHGSSLSKFLCNLIRRPFWWSQTGWTGFGSSLRPDAWAWYRWMVLPSLLIDNLKLESVSLRFYHREPALRTWSIFWASIRKKLTFLMIMTKKGSLIPKVYFSLAGHVT